MATSMNLNTLLEQVRTADGRQVRAQYAIGGILQTIFKAKLFDERFKSFNKMVEKELAFSTATADSYRVLYNCQERLGYNKEEYLVLMQKFGWRNLAEVLRSSKNKMCARDIKRLLDRKLSSSFYFNINAGSQPAAVRMDARLTNFGMDISQGGHRSKMSSSFELLMEDYDRLKAMEARMTRAKQGTVRKDQMELDVE